MNATTTPATTPAEMDRLIIERRIDSEIDTITMRIRSGRTAICSQRDLDKLNKFEKQLADFADEIDRAIVDTLTSNR